MSETNSGREKIGRFDHQFEGKAMEDVYIIGSCSTRFGRRPDDDHRALAREAVTGALSDAGLENAAPIDQAYFGNCLMHIQGQTMIRG